jgi:hypothetical protein
MTCTGGCLCGRIRYAVVEEPDDAVHCYCSMCRRHGGTGVQTFVRFRREALQMLGDEPAWYRSSAAASRAFCPECGSSIGMAYDRQVEYVWVTAGTLDETVGVRPRRHVRAEDRVPWIALGPIIRKARGD